MHTVLAPASATDAAIHAIATVVADLGHGNFPLDVSGGTLTCKRVMVTSDKLLKIDSKQIHPGVEQHE